MHSFLHHPLTVFMGFFAIMNPIANVSIFLGLTDAFDDRTRKAVALRSVALAFIIVVVFSIAGRLIFQAFSITLPAFRITGGLLIMFIGFHMLQGDQSRVHHLKEEDNQKILDAELNVAISPLAVPILAGPGTIATAMNFSSGGGLGGMTVTIAAFGILCVITYAFFIFGERFVAFIGAGILGFITRLMGLILAVIGAQMVIDGLRGAFKLP